MEDFFYAGGLRAVLRRLLPHLHANAITVTGRPLIDGLEAAGLYNDDVIRPLDRPIYAEGATAVLRGNLAPDGCVMKPAAAEARFRRHRGPALAFESYGEMKAAIERDDLEVTPDHVLVLKNAGPLGGPGMPEWGMLPIPRKLVKAGVRDMLRLSDARMSGTAYGACVLHISPEAFIGGPLALVETGDIIAVDVARRSIELEVADEILQARRSRWKAPRARYERGFGWLAGRHMTQAHRGCDFDFLETGFGAAVGEPAIY
jgi:dihydroxy-acid dehydratase